MAKYNISEKKEKNARYRRMLSRSVMDDIQRKILDLVVMQKRYLLKDYNAGRLAADINVDPRYISAVVNARFHRNFASFINSYRVNDAMTILSDSRYDDLTMEEVSERVGFANRQSLYSAFYREKGVTPRRYRLRCQGKE